MKARKQGLPVILLSLSAVLLGAAAARAECYDILGCSNKDAFSKHVADYLMDANSGPTCDFLYTMRNQIFSEHGYCFTSPRARAAFGDNQSCTVHDLAALKLNRVERANVATIELVENQRRCSK